MMIGFIYSLGGHVQARMGLDEKPHRCADETNVTEVSF